MILRGRRGIDRSGAGQRWLRPVVLSLFVAFLGACAPELAEPGPARIEPSLLADQLVTSDGTALPLRAWLPEGPVEAVVLALHGFNDYSNAFAESGHRWADLGIATYAYDQRGFGNTPNRGLWPDIATLTDDLRTAARLVHNRHPQAPIYLLGESMGGAVAMVAMTGANPPDVDGIILSAPAVWARSTMPVYQRVALWIAAYTIPWAKLSGRGLEIQASDNIEMLMALGRDPLIIGETRVDAIYGLVDLMDQALAAAPRLDVPALLLYGEKDEIVPLEATLQLWRGLPAAAAGEQRIALYADGWHMLLRDLQAQVVIADIAAWIADPAAPLPSGADDRALAAILATEETS